MRKLLFITTLLAASVASFATTPALASSYITVEGTSVTVEDNLDGDINPMGLRFRFGTPIGKNLDMEAHLGFGMDDRNSNYEEFSSAVAGVFLKAYIPIGFNSAFYGLAGYSAMTITQTVNGQDFEDERRGLSYGAGFETKISGRVDLTADYVRYVKDEGLYEDISAVSLGLKFYF